MSLPGTDECGDEVDDTWERLKRQYPVASTRRRSGRELSPRNSVLRRNFFGVVQHDHLDGDPPRFQLEPQFLLQDLENRARGHVDDALRRTSPMVSALGMGWPSQRFQNRD